MSKILNAIALFLPLKILILVSSDGVPKYFEFFHGWMSRDDFIFFILALTPVVYFLYLATGFWSHRILVSDFSKCDDVVIKKDYYEISGKKVKWFHDHCSKGSSELFIIAISLASLLLISFAFFGVIVFISAVYFLTMSYFLYPKDSSYKELVFNVPFGSFVEYCSALLYFLIFFILVVYLYVGFLGLYESLLGLLMARLMVQSIQRLLVEGYFIDKDIKSVVKQQ